MNTFRYRSSYWFVIIIVLLTVITGCFNESDSGKVDEQVYATVNGVHLTESDLRTIVPVEFYDRLTSEHKQLIVEDWIYQELLYQEAVNDGIDREPDIERLLIQSQQQLLSNELLERRLRNIQEPSDTQLEQYYTENEDIFVLPTNEYRVRFALFDNQSDVNNFHYQVKRNASFSDLSREMSKDPSSVDGGDIGVVNEDVIDPSIWESIIATKRKYGLHKISDPFTISDGWGCVIIDEQFEAGTIKPFEYVKDNVYDLYMTEKREEEKQAFIKELVEKAEIERYAFNR